MNALKYKLLNNWSIVRIVRLAIGLWLAVLGIQSADWATGLFGGFFLYQALTDTGCCGSGACAPPRSQKAKGGEETIDFEEIK